MNRGAVIKVAVNIQGGRVPCVAVNVVTAERPPERARVVLGSIPRVSVLSC